MCPAEHEEYYRRLGATIARRRKACGMTQEQLAEDIGMTRPGMAQVETGRSRIMVDRLLDIAHFLQCEAWEILQEANQ